MNWNELEISSDETQLRTALRLPADAALDFSLLGQGEYNRNYLFSHPVTGKKLVLRQSTGSQMHLRDQIGYEFRALQLLEACGRTPKPLWLDSKASVLVEEFLPGRTLDYRRDLPGAAECLAAIHDTPASTDCPLLHPADPTGAIRAECAEMASKYLEYPSADPEISQRIRSLLALAEQSDGEEDRLLPVILNTELNSGNFLVEGDRVMLVDWEKPILGESAQDLGHFLAPTTTLWKTEIRLSGEEKLDFLRKYHESRKNPEPFELLLHRTRRYEAMNCLRGVCWCAMAWVEYQDPQRPIRNADTYRKIVSYLQPEFLDGICADYFGR